MFVRLLVEPLTWQEMKHLQQGPRLWHTSASIYQSIKSVVYVVRFVLS
jgi:hypothetical protein